MKVVEEKVFWDGWVAVEWTGVVYPAFGIDFGFRRDSERFLKDTDSVALFYGELVLGY